MNTASVKNYSPRADSLPSRVIDFFRRCPDEELDLEAINDKFDATRGNIHTQLALAVDAGVLLRNRNEDGDYIYRAGPAIAKPETVRATALAAALASSPGKGHARARHLIDLAALQVDEGIPCPVSGAKGQGKWEPLFAKLTRPGQSIAVPGPIKAALTAAANKRNKEKRGSFRVAMTGPGQARIWRTA